MGADLYIENMDREKQYTGFQTKVDFGYFRDCYNDGGLFNFFRSNLTKDDDWSWWQMIDDKKYKVDEEGNMPIEGAKEFLKRVEEAKKELDKKDKYILKYTDWTRDENGKMNTKEKTKEMSDAEASEYIAWTQDLIDFLKLAIKKKSRIIFSV